MAAWRVERGAGFYAAALCCAQALWLQGKPAQAVLQLNRAWSAALGPGDPVLEEWPPPYRALAWILRHAPGQGFLGNPVRHFQHLATRMHGIRRAPRVWRAWACFHLAEAVPGGGGHPRDETQLRHEGIIIPPPQRVSEGLAAEGWNAEAGLFVEVLRECLAGR